MLVGTKLGIKFVAVALPAVLIAISPISYADEAAFDLSVTQTDASDPVTAGANVTYTATATNNGPGKASEVVLTDNLPTGSTFVSATPTQGSCSTPSGSLVTCALGLIAEGNSAGVQVTVTSPSSQGTITNRVVIDSNKNGWTDPNPDNNASEETTTVESPAEGDDTATGTVTNGGTVSTGTTASPTNPTSTTVTVPTGISGTVTIDEITVSGSGVDCGAGFSCFGQSVDITAPQASAGRPLRLVFLYDASDIPPGLRTSRAKMFDDGVLVPRCDKGVKTASPDPCLAGVKKLSGGDFRFTVRSSTNGRWRPG